MPITSCERVMRGLARLEAEIDGDEIEAVVAGLIRFVDDALRPAYASVLLCAPDASACDVWRISPADGALQREPGAPSTDIRSAVPADGRAIYWRDRVEASDPGGPLLRGLPADVRSVLIVPLKTGRSVVGILSVGSAAGDGFSAEERALLEAAAPRAAGALRIAHLVEQDHERQSACDADRTALRQEARDPKGRDTADGQTEPAWGAFVGRSAALRRVVGRIERVAPTDAGVLILGESGTGKELAADDIHRRSRRSDRPLVKVNCASIPRELYESEFFGHVKGAFTGAINDRVGRFETADGGTLFLDEVGEIPLGLQGKLLRVLQSGDFERVGEGRTRTVDVRIIAATNKRLQEEVAAGRFREDLYYRLNVFPIEVPPLRERREDIPPLAAHIAASVAARMHLPAPLLSEEDLRALQAYGWPGNVRELQNVIERALILSGPDPPVFELPGVDAPDRSKPGPPEDAPTRAAVMTETEVLELQRRNLTAALVRCGWTIYGEFGAAKLLGIKPTTLIERMRRMGIRRPH